MNTVKEASASQMQREIRYRRQSKAAATESATVESAGAVAITAEDVKARLEAQLQAAYEEARALRTEVAEPLYWWEIYAIGPIEPGALLVPPAGPLDQPLLPNKVIKEGNKAYIATVLILNPFPLPQDPNIIPCDWLSVWELPYQVEYHTANVTDVKKGPADLNVTHQNQYMHLVPGQCFYVDVLEFTAQEEGCVFETNICARILDCNFRTPTKSPFAGFARTTINLDPELFFPSETLEFDNPLRFMVYGEQV